MDGVWYLPHFATSQVKFHGVYDVATQYLGTSINDHILPGPDLLNSLVNVLSRFRLGEYTITAFLRECFFRGWTPRKPERLFQNVMF